MEVFATPEMRNTFGVLLKDENYVDFGDMMDGDDDEEKPEPSQ